MKLCGIFSIAIFLVAQISAQYISPTPMVTKKYYLITLAPVNWFKAFNHCRSMDMNLVSITSKEENDRIIKQIQDENHQDKDFWTSGNKLGSNGVYQWMSTGKVVKFTDWAQGQPDNQFRENQHESCINIFNIGRGPGAGLMWNDHLCSAELYFICEQDFIQYGYCVNQTC
ncbi:C-type lectin 37Db-like [Sitodiplosis mosellana]|uniref:C-type lectin 37Db-like n=1 Tax=Sitodiplosis mosellana TaxID=263140 RepID=UPI0024445B52|nr:C-type lectin 37Db-like [Sitodiplosis mosellana]